MRSADWWDGWLVGAWQSLVATLILVALVEYF